MKKFNQIILILLVQIICFQQIIFAQDTINLPVKKSVQDTIKVNKPSKRRAEQDTIRPVKTSRKNSLQDTIQPEKSSKKKIVQDTTLVDVPVRKRFTPDPVKATMLAVALPGVGQLYNRKYWKVPLVYAGFGGLAYAIKINSGEYAKFMKAYQDFTDEIPQTNSYLNINGLQGVDPKKLNIKDYDYYKEQMIRYIDQYKRYRDLSYIGIGVWYMITILDANVDASLFNYDVSDNLNVAVMPFQMTTPGGFLGAGINVSLNLNF